MHLKNVCFCLFIIGNAYIYKKYNLLVDKIFVTIKKTTFYKKNKIYDIQESPEDYIEGYDDGDARGLNESSHTLSEKDLSILPTLNIIARHKAISPISMRVNDDVFNIIIIMCVV